MPVLRRLLREPLLHFVLIGAALFLLYGIVNRGGTDAPREIVVSGARVAALAENFASVWLRPPTPVEIKGLVDDYVAEEIYYREAIAMGLDQDDTVIRRRLRQKMEFVSDGIADAAEPTDAELQGFLEQNAARFAQPDMLTFRQVFLNAGRRGTTVRADAERLLTRLQASRDDAGVADAGDATLLPAGMASASPQDIANTFGKEFAAQVDEAPVGQWAGPFESGFGLHLVRVDERVAGKAPTLADIRPAVLREWQSAARRKYTESFLATLREKYDVRVEGPSAASFETQAGSTSP